MITRAISVLADAVVLGITLWKVYYIFRVDKEARATTTITTTLAYNGTVPSITTLVRTISLMKLWHRQYSIRVWYPFFSTPVSSKHRSRSLLALNVLMVILDILSVATDHVRAFTSPLHRFSWYPSSLKMRRNSYSSKMCEYNIHSPSSFLTVIS